LLSGTSLATDLDTRSLLEKLVRPASESTTFVEIRYSSLLTEPIVASGEFEYRMDGALVRRITSPYAETTVLAGETVVVEREGSKPRQFSLDRAPELRGMLTSIRALLQGDRAELERHFSVTTTGNDAGWQMELTPRDRKLRTKIALIRVDGVEGVPLCFAMVEPDGDASLLALGINDRAALPAALDRQSLQAWCTGHTKVQ
jgi:hypothetical protein